MKIIPVHKQPQYGSKRTLSTAANAVNSTRDCLSYTFSGKTALGRFTNKHPRVSAVTTLVLLGCLISGIMGMFKSENRQSSELVVDNTTELIDVQGADYLTE